MSIIHIVAISLVFIISLSISSCSSDNKDYISGTYTNMHVNENSGDILGYTIKIGKEKGFYCASIQYSEGSPSKIIAGRNLNIHENIISFYFISPGGDKARFIGKVLNDKLIGDIYYTDIDNPKLRNNYEYNHLVLQRRNNIIYRMIRSLRRAIAFILTKDACYV